MHAQHITTETVVYTAIVSFGKTSDGSLDRHFAGTFLSYEEAKRVGVAQATAWSDADVKVVSHRIGQELHY